MDGNPPTSVPPRLASGIDQEVFAREVPRQTSGPASGCLRMRSAEATRLLSATRHVLDEINMMAPGWHGPQLNEMVLWKELVACILGSVVPFGLARTYADHLDSVGLLAEAQLASNL